MKRLVDIFFSFIGLVLLFPILLVLMFLVWIQDFHSPFFVARRVGLNGKPFKMVKLRTMIVNADKNGVMSTAGSDTRITRVGKIIRKFKFDELVQLYNVLIGEMSLVGPRPNTWKHGVELYTDEEKRLLSVRPGITDISSIVFSNEGEILKGKKDPDLSYNQLIRPWKSRLGLIYIDGCNVILDFKIILITLVAILSRKTAMSLVVNELKRLNVCEDVISIVLHDNDLVPAPPPGSNQIITRRHML